MSRTSVCSFVKVLGAQYTAGFPPLNVGVRSFRCRSIELERIEASEYSPEDEGEIWRSVAVVVDVIRALIIAPFGTDSSTVAKSNIKTSKLSFMEPGLIRTHFQNHFYLEGKARSCDHSGKARYLIGYSVNRYRQRRKPVCLEN